MPVSAYLALAVVTSLLVPAVHAIRRRTSLVFTYAVVAVMAFAGWAIPHDVAVTFGAFTLGLTSTVFYGALLGGVFLLYVVDGPRAGRMGVAVVIGVGVLYIVLATPLRLLGSGERFLRLDGPLACAASLAASLVSLLLLGIAWEGSQRHWPALGIFPRVLGVLLTVMLGDTLVYFPVAWWSRPGFGRSFAGALLARVVLAVFYAPVFAAYLQYEVRRYGLKLAARPVLSIVTLEDLERELLSARHDLRLGTEALWMSEEQYRRMVDDIPLFVCRFARDGTVTYANRALCEQRGLPLGEVLGRSVLESVAPEERERVWSKVTAVSPRLPTAEVTVSVARAAGGGTEPRAQSPRVERWIVRGVFSPGREGIAYQAIGEDVTRELELEAAAQRADRMEAFAQLAGGVAHDFNNLLAVVRSSATLARESPGDSPDAREALDDILKATDRAALLTQQLRAISRQEQVSPRRVDLSQLVSELAPLVRRLLPERIRLELDCAPCLPLALVDPSQLERVVVNLVVNAREAMPEGGAVTISTRTTVLYGDALHAHSDVQPRRHIVLEVQDTGHGMDEAVMKRMFEPFFTTRGDSGGTGLGLATVHGIIQQAGGFVKVESAPGAGATLQIHLPALADA